MLSDAGNRRISIYGDQVHQRCVAHFYQNVFSVVPKSKIKKVAQMSRCSMLHVRESKKASREKAVAVIAELKSMKLSESAKKVANGIEEP